MTQNLINVEPLNGPIILAQHHGNEPNFIAAPILQKGDYVIFRNGQSRARTDLYRETLQNCDDLSFLRNQGLNYEAVRRRVDHAHIFQIVKILFVLSHHCFQVFTYASFDFFTKLEHMIVTRDQKISKFTWQE